MPSATRVRAFVIVFTLFFLAALLFVVVEEFSDVEWVESARRIAEGIGRLTFVAIAATFILVEGIPMLASWIRRQEINQAREEGRQMERETWLDWKRRLDEWEERRVAAARENRPFTEERPAPPDS